MSLWLVRAGQHGEYEQQFLTTNRIYLTWEELADTDLSQIRTYEAVKDVLRAAFPDAPERRLGNYAGQIWAFISRMSPGDWAVLPRTHWSVIAVAEIVGGFTYDAQAEPSYRFYREVGWLNQEVPRTAFDQDLLYSFGAFMTVCQIQRNDAERRVRQMSVNGWTAPSVPPLLTGDVATDADAVDELVDLERLARDHIAKLIIQKFKGHGMAWLVESILKAQGYTTYRSPEGADQGIDLLAAPGPLGFGRPRICVQVKSQDSPVDRPTLDQLVGAMQNVQADQGLLVSWGGFKSSVRRETANQFFRVRLWDQDTLINELLDNYGQLGEDLRADIPLKRIWTVAAQEEGE